MKLICAIDNNWSIGYDGDMLFRIPQDLERFREITEGNIIIMGRKTFESLPNKKALPNRINIVLTRNKGYTADNIIVINSLEELFVQLKKVNFDNKKSNFVIGGGDIACKLLPYCNKAYITKVFRNFNDIDTQIPNLDIDKDWIIERESDIYNYNDLKYKYINYIRVK